MVLSQRMLTSGLPVSISKAEALPAPAIMAMATARGCIRFPARVCLLLFITSCPFLCRSVLGAYPGYPYFDEANYPDRRKLAPPHSRGGGGRFGGGAGPA